LIVYGDNKPTTFTVEKQPKRPGYCLVRFYENAEPHKAEGYTGWQYDEYHLELADRPDLQGYVQNHYNELLQEAKGGPSEMERLRADLDYILLMGGF
jgi:hypothetical protein